MFSFTRREKILERNQGIIYICIDKYIKITQNSSKTLEEVINKTDILIKLIEKLDKEFKQF